MRTILNSVIGLYATVIIILGIYSYGFVDPHLTLFTNSIYNGFHLMLTDLVFNKRVVSTAIFMVITLLLFLFYFLFLRLSQKKKWSIKQIIVILGITIGILLFSYPAFSYDIFNYILTAKITFLYKENPYLVMPIELIGEPNLAFTRAANKIALYGPLWIILSLFPYLGGFGNIVATIFSFKVFIMLFYILTLWIIYKLTKSNYSIVLFALHPLVIIEILISSHNDIVMMFLALVSFYFLKQKKIFFSVTFLFLSILIKYATLFLLPVFIFVLIRYWKKKQVNWDTIYYASGWSMIFVFLFSALREEIYPWYSIWFLSFAVLVPRKTFLFLLSMAFSIGTMFTYMPVLYTGSYFGKTPIIKIVSIFILPTVLFITYILSFAKNLLMKRN